MKLSARQLAQALYQAVKKNPHERTRLIKQFLNLIRRKRLGKSLAGVLRQLDQVELEQSGKVKVRIETKLSLSTKLINKLKKLLQQKYHYKTVEPEIIINPDLIGGIKINFNDVMIDGSVKNQYEKFLS